MSRKISSHDQSSTNEKRFSISTRIPPSSPTRRLMTRSIDLSADQLDREENNKGLLTTVHSSIIYKHEDKNDHSSSRDDSMYPSIIQLDEMTNQKTNDIINLYNKILMFVFS